MGDPLDRLKERSSLTIAIPMKEKRIYEWLA